MPNPGYNGMPSNVPYGAYDDGGTSGYNGMPSDVAERMRDGNVPTDSGANYYNAGGSSASSSDQYVRSLSGFRKENSDALYPAGDSSTTKDDVDDGGASNAIHTDPFSTRSIFDGDVFQNLKHSYGIYDRKDINLFDKTYRFGLFNPDAAVSGLREFLFFTKPDLNIIARGPEESHVSYSNGLNQALEAPKNSSGNGSVKYDGLANRTFWANLIRDYPGVIMSLQSSIRESGKPADPFIHLLQNTVKTNIDIPALNSEGIDTATNMYGVNLTYRGSSESSDDSFDFSLEFRDTKWLPVYLFFRAYEEYETLKHHGIIQPWKKYITSKVLHDQFSIYKFLVDDDMETILYYGKYYGVYPKSLPRDTFAQEDFNQGLSYSIDFKAAFFEDMNPEILSDFNYLGEELWNGTKYDVDTYNASLDRVDTRAVRAARVFKYKRNDVPGGFVYKLKWRGGDQS